MTLSIVIPSYNEGNYIEATLSAIKDHLTAFDYEIIVVDGGSQDGTIEAAERHANLVIKTGRTTIAKARNIGAEKATGAYLVFIDADVIIEDPDSFFARALTDFERIPHLVGLTVFFRTIPSLARRSDAFFRGAINYLHLLNNNVLHTGSASGEFMMVKTSAFRTIGGLRSELVVAEDSDLFHRLRAQGETYADPKLHIFHTERRAHTIGWLALYAIWTKNSLAWMFFGNRGASKEWTPIR